MSQPRIPILRLLTLLTATCLPLHAQSSPSFNRNLILLDPAHGGSETGARIEDQLLEKDVNLAFAARLHTLLSAAGFNVLTTRDADPPTTAASDSAASLTTAPLTTDQRASIANHARPRACIVIHATASGSGVHLSTSSLSDQSPDEPSTIIPWDTAQTAYLAQSSRLANELGVALIHAQIPTLLGRASLRPLDNLTCPAIAIELAPLPHTGSDPTPVSDSGYQQRIAQAITSGLTAWRNRLDPSSTPPAHPTASPTTKSPATKPGLIKPSLIKPGLNNPSSNQTGPNPTPSATKPPVPKPSSTTQPQPAATDPAATKPAPRSTNHPAAPPATNPNPQPAPEKPTPAPELAPGAAR